MSESTGVSSALRQLVVYTLLNLASHPLLYNHYCQAFNLGLMGEKKGVLNLSQYYIIKK